jgi:hypothetical protein
MESSTEGNKQGSDTSRLDAWLARATHGLCPQARERVRREITAHHAETVHHLRETGVSPDDTEAQVLESLGDAVAANKALRKTYLTSWQQRLLASLSRPTEPIKAPHYRWLVFLISFAAAGVLVYTDFELHLYEQNDLNSLLCSSLSLFFLMSWVFILCLGLARVLSGYLRRFRNLPPVQRSSAEKLRYPWLLIVGFILLYVLWRVKYIPFSGRVNAANDLFVAIVCNTLIPRLHRRIAHFIFGPCHRCNQRRTALGLSYMALWWMISLTCILLPSSPFWVRDFLQLTVGAEPLEFGTSPPDLVLGYVYGLVTVVASIFLFVCSVRWTIGLYLRRKEVNGDSSDVPIPAPFPETPLGE